MFCNRHRVWCRYRKAYLSSLTRSDFGLSRYPPKTGSEWAKKMSSEHPLLNGVDSDGSIERFIELQPPEKRENLYKGNRLYEAILKLIFRL